MCDCADLLQEAFRARVAFERAELRDAVTPAIRLRRDAARLALLASDAIPCTDWCALYPHSGSVSRESSVIP